MEIPPPDPYEIALEVEAQVGARSPSPTPFKIAESLASTGRKGFSGSHGRGISSSPYVSSYQQTARFDSSRQSSALQSRSSSPSRANLPFRRSESTASLSRVSFDGGGLSHGKEPAPRSSWQSAHSRRVESGTLPRNFKSVTSSIKSQSSTVSDFRSALRKTEDNGCFSGRGRESSSPLRGDYNPPGQMSLRKTEIASSSSHRRGRDSRSSSPPRKTSDSLLDSFSSPRRNFSAFSQSLLRKSESVVSLNGRGQLGRCGSPIREGYDIESQALLRNSILQQNGLNNQKYEEENPIVSPSKRSYDAPSRSILRKTESNAVGSSRSPSPGRRGYETSTRYQLRKTDAGGSLNSRSHESRNSSPSRRSYEAPSRSSLRKSEVNSSARTHESRSVLPSRRSLDLPDQRSQWKPESINSFSSNNHNSRSSSASRKGNNDPPGYSVLRDAINGDSGRSSRGINAPKESKSDSRPSPRFCQESSHSIRSSSLSRAASPARQAKTSSQTAFVTLNTPKSPSSSRSGGSRHLRDERCPSPNNKKPSQGQNPSFSPQIQFRRHTSSQSSMESSESGQLSVGSTGRNREEYAVIADLPKVKMIHHTDRPGHMGQQQNQQSSRELFKPAR